MKEEKKIKGKVRFASNYGYICQCGIRDYVELECGHSFCIGCVARDVDRLVFDEKQVDDKEKKLKTIECGKCQSRFRISDIRLQCGCEFKCFSPEELHVSVDKKIGIIH